ncbi:hypothetical protein [Metabacillus litoralis]|uniref:hypothetical protein n=1 Tax=Metabacillus litoralis TaxID=152268 RepID=UPI00203CD324|nr:hypothetical protein [Metabacillus litoralis]MCM3412699.1 hypothetical protein [Metabacillus litoralis]
MRDLIEKVGILEKKVSTLLEQGEKQASINLIQEMSEILSSTLFHLQKETDKKILSFINDRLDAIKNIETPIPLLPGGKVVVHLIPIQAFEDESNLDISTFRDKAHQLPQLCQSGYDYRFNYDGFITYNRSNHRSSYVQVFRNGCMEIVDNGIINGSENLINVIRFEEVMIHILPKYLKVLYECEIPGPFFVYTTFVGVKGHSLYHGTFFDTYQIDKDELRLPKILIEESNADLALSLKPAFNVLWNSGGFPGSINYADGTWKPRN